MVTVVMPALGENIPVESALFLARNRGLDEWSQQLLDYFIEGKLLEPSHRQYVLDHCFTKPLEPWQQYVLDCFPESSHLPTPTYVDGVQSLWRLKDWEHLASDTIACYGTQMVAKLSMVYRPKVIVEFGVRDGTTTLLLCKLNPNARVYGIDLYSRVSCGPVDHHVPTGFTALMQNVNNLTLHIGNSWDFLAPGLVDLCFVDAEHCGDAPYKDTLRAWENRNSSGDWCIAWDDYHPNNPDVYSAVNRFVGDVGMELWWVGSWVYIGTKKVE